MTKRLVWRHLWLVKGSFHSTLIDLSLCCWATNLAFSIASWVSSSLIPRCHTALTVPPTWGNIRTWTPWPRAFTSSSSTPAIRSQNSAGLIWVSPRRNLKMLVSTVFTSNWYRGGSHCNNAKRGKAKTFHQNPEMELWIFKFGSVEHKRRHLNNHILNVLNGDWIRAFIFDWTVSLSLF